MDDEGLSAKDCWAAEQIRAHLERNKGAFFNARALAQIAGLSTAGTQVTTRKLITYLVEKLYCPIISNDRGYTWAVSSIMLTTYLQDLDNRIMGLKRRVTAVGKIYHKMSSEEGGVAHNRGDPCPRCGAAVEVDQSLCKFCRAAAALEERRRNG